MNTIKSVITALIILIVIFGTGFYSGIQYEKKYDQPNVTQATQAQIEDTKFLKDKTGASNPESAKLKEAIRDAKNNKPAQSYTVEAKTSQEAAQKVTEQIKQNQSPALSVPGQYTFIVPEVGKNTVDVYRVTTEHARLGLSGIVLAGGSVRPEVGIGVGWINRDNALATGVTSEKRIYALAIHHF